MRVKLKTGTRWVNIRGDLRMAEIDMHGVSTIEASVSDIKDLESAGYLATEEDEIPEVDPDSEDPDATIEEEPAIGAGEIPDVANMQASKVNEVLQKINSQATLRAMIEAEEKREGGGRPPIIRSLKKRLGFIIHQASK